MFSVGDFPFLASIFDGEMCSSMVSIVELYTSFIRIDLIFRIRKIPLSCWRLIGDFFFFGIDDISKFWKKFGILHSFLILLQRIMIDSFKSVPALMNNTFTRPDESAHWLRFSDFNTLSTSRPVQSLYLLHADISSALLNSFSTLSKYHTKSGHIGLNLNLWWKWSKYRFLSSLWPVIICPSIFSFAVGSVVCFFGKKLFFTFHIPVCWL